MMSETRESQPGVAANKMTSADLAPSIFRLYSTCMDEPAEWAQADPFTWDLLATKAIRLIDGAIRSEASLSVLELGKTLAAWGHAGEVEEVWTRLEMLERLAWQTVGRHLVNCLDSEPGSVNVPELEQKMLQWFRAKKLALNL